MDNWQSTFLGSKRLPRELTAFEIEAFFTFTRAERQLIEDRRRAELMFGLALQIGFLRMSGRLLDAVPMIPPALWRHLGTQFAVAAPDLASLRALYRRAPTLIEHQQLACEALGFRWLSEPQRRALVRALRRELTRTRDRERLLMFARRWLYDHHLIIMHERALRSIIASATRQYEAALARSIHEEIDSERLERWRQALVMPREAGLSQQSWLWATPAKHSPQQLKSPPHSPMAKAICERVIGTVRRECLDWLIPLSESHLRSILKSGIPHYNTARRHMALGPGVPDPPAATHHNFNSRSRHRLREDVAVRANAVLGGLHHEYFLVPIVAPLSICG